jgi:hypothetical protein
MKQISKTFGLALLLGAACFLLSPVAQTGCAFASQADDMGPSVTTSAPVHPEPPVSNDAEAAPATIPRPNGSRTCPSTRYLDCMPRISGEARPMCSPEYVRWIKENCPGVTITY